MHGEGRTHRGERLPNPVTHPGPKDSAGNCACLVIIIPTLLA